MIEMIAETWYMTIKNILGKLADVLAESALVLGFVLGWVVGVLILIAIALAVGGLILLVLRELVRFLGS